VENTTAVLIGAGIAAFSGLTGALTTAYLGGWRQERLEANKRYWSLEDAKVKRLDDTFSQLTVKLASALHSMCWITWIAYEAPARVTQEQVTAYDNEMHTILPEILGSWSQIASLSMEAHSLAEPAVRSVFRLDAEIGKVCLDIVDQQAKAAQALADLHPVCVEKEQALPLLMADIVRRSSQKLNRPEASTQI
jgi:hypothetical protein